MTKTIRTARNISLVIVVGMAFGVPTSQSGQPVQAQATYQVDSSWPQWPAGARFEYASGVAVDAQGIVYGFMRDTDEKAGQGGTGSVVRFDRNGKYLGKWGPSDFVTPHSIYIDREGAVWTVDRDGQQVKKFSAAGDLLMTLGKKRVFGRNPDTFNGPTAVAFLPNGDFVVSDGYWNSRLVWFNKDGKFLRDVGTFGREPGQIGNPHGMAVDARGRFIVADLCPALHQDAVVPGQIGAYLTKPIPGCKNRLQVLDSNGKHVTFWESRKDPLSINVVGERVYVGQFGGKDIEVLDAASGKLLEVIEGASPSHSHQVAVDQKTGDIYVASVYPEHGKQSRGPGGPSLRRLSRSLK